MFVRNYAYLRANVVTWLVAVFMLSAAVSRAGDIWLESTGARGGFSVSGAARGFEQAEGFANVHLPWGWDLGKEWHLQSQADLSLGWFGDSRNNATIGSVGPSLLLTQRSLPLSLEGGVSPTFLSRSDFEDKDFGGTFQFTTHVDVNWDFAPHWRLTGRFQHMSNAGLASPNPGLNMVLFGLSYVF
jgi:lipid A 3-O-deacylase